ncbi:MAG: DUF480 domain-containing protein [Planctomycetota bacterium]
MSKLPELNGHEARLLAVLYEKERTTPDQYPLSLHALTAGANQKSNRDPMTDWSEAEVFVGVTGLMQKGLAGKVFPAGSRVEKFRHNARETLGLDERKLAILSELLMRGPQTLGELRTRAGRMSELGANDSVQSDLASLAQSGFVRRLEPGPGSRAERWVQLLSAGLHPLNAPSTAQPAEARSSRAEPGLEQRVAELESRVEALERALTRPD